MLKLANTARSNNGNVHCTGNCSRERQVEAVFAAVAIHAGKKDFTCAAACRLGSPLDSVEARVLAAAMHIHFPLVGIAGNLLGINRAQNSLRAERRSRFCDERRVGNSSGIHRNLVGASGNHGTNVFHAAEPAAHAVRQMQFFACATCHAHRGCTTLMRCRDVQEDNLISTLLVIALSQLDRVARITQVNEVNTLNHTTVFNIHARYYTLRKH